MNYIKNEKYVTMRAWREVIYLHLHSKDTRQQHPILLTRTSYSSWPYGKVENRPFWGNFYKKYLKEKYIMVIQDVRGRWMSEGSFVDIRLQLN